VKMARSFSNIVLAYCEACGSAPRAQRISVRLLLRYAEKSGRIISAAPSLLYVLTITTVTLNTSCND
jgi:hypothetical protein